MIIIGYPWMKFCKKEKIGNILYLPYYRLFGNYENDDDYVKVDWGEVYWQLACTLSKIGYDVMIDSDEFSVQAEKYKKFLTDDVVALVPDKSIEKEWIEKNIQSVYDPNDDESILEGVIKDIKEELDYFRNNLETITINSLNEDLESLLRYEKCKQNLQSILSVKQFTDQEIKQIKDCISKMDSFLEFNKEQTITTKWI